MNKRTVLLSSVLVVLLAVSYFLYQKYEYSRRPVSKKAGSVHLQQEENIERDENAAPAIKKAKLQLESSENIDRIRVIIEKDRDDARVIQYRYEWFKNSQPVAGNEDNVTGFKKGDRIEVKITPFVDKHYGQPRLLRFTVARVPPKIVENKTIGFEGDVLHYQVKAVDPDGGALTYSLVNPLEGMTIDSATGLIKWRVKTKDAGKYSISVMIKNTGGAEVVYPLTLDIGKADE